MDPDEICREVLNRHCNDIRQSSLDPADVSACLLQEGALNQSALEKVRNQSSLSDKIDIVVEAVRRGGPRAYALFLGAIKKERSTKWLGDLLEACKQLILLEHSFDNILAEQNELLRVQPTKRSSRNRTLRLDELCEKPANFDNIVGVIPNLSPMNFKPLEHIIQHFKQQHMLSKMSEFVQQRSQFLASTTMADFIKIWKWDKIYSLGFADLKTKHSLVPSEHSAEWIDYFSEDFSSHHSFNDCAILLKHIFPPTADVHATTVVWLLPRGLMKKLPNKILQCGSDCQLAAKYDITEITYGNNSVCFKQTNDPKNIGHCGSDVYGSASAELQVDTGGGAQTETDTINQSVGKSINQPECSSETDECSNNIGFSDASVNQGTHMIPHLPDELPHMDDAKRKQLIREGEESKDKLMGVLTNLNFAFKEWMKIASLDNHKEALCTIPGTKPLKKKSPTAIPLFEDRRQDIMMASSYLDLRNIVYDYVCWTNYKLLAVIVNVVSRDTKTTTSTCKVEFDAAYAAYEDALKQYYKNSPKYFTSTNPAPGSEIKVKVQMPFETITLGEIERFEGEMARALNLEPYSLKLCQCTEGCTQLLYSIPQCLHHSLLPLSDEKLKQLSLLQIIELEMIGYHFILDKDTHILKLSCGTKMREEMDSKGELAVHKTDLTSEICEEQKGVTGSGKKLTSDEMISSTELVSDKEVEIQTSPTERMKEDAMITEKESPKEPLQTDSVIDEHVLHLINELELPRDEYFCPVTYELLVDPYQTECCGKHISQQALQRLSKTPCPLCKSATFGTYPDRGFQKKVKKLKVRCQYSDQGCRWEGSLDELEKHSQESRDYHSTLHAITSIVPQEFTLNKYEEFRKSKKPWFSPSFYTSPLGYRLCLRVNAENNGHLSVYIYLMKGVNDNSLTFPFSGKVLVQLINQRSSDDKSAKHLETFIVFDDTVDKKHTARVEGSERQTYGWGNSMFLPLSNPAMIHEYLKTDCLKFRINV